MRPQSGPAAALPLLIVTVAAASLGGAAAGRQAAPPSAQQPPQPTFRTGVTVVPVDVRVLDRNGKPLTDLKQEDFIVLEDGAPQEIRHFSARGLVPMPVSPEAKPDIRTSASSPVRQQSSRIFLIVLGRGRLQYPSKGVDAAIHFVRNRLLPQDQVAVMAFNRASEFTTNRAATLQVLERFKSRHEDIEAGLRHQMSGLAALYGSLDPAAALQREIDAIFEGSEGRTARAVPPSQTPELQRATTAARRAADNLARADIIAGREQTIGDTFDLFAGEMVGMPFEQYVSTSVETLHDLGNLYTGIEYLHFLEGEKHILFLTEQGFYSPLSEDDARLAARANHARVVIDTIQTGGIDRMPSPLESGSLVPATVAPRQPSPTLASATSGNVEMGRMQALEQMSALTGGLSSVHRYAQPAVDRVDTATRFGYLIGYQPLNTRIDRRYRRITVRVNRPDVTVLFRHGYYAEDIPLPLDRRAFTTSRRISAAGEYGAAIPDIRVTLTPTVKRVQGVAEVNVVLNIDASRIAFTAAEGRHVADLDLIIYASDDKERLITESRHKIDLKLKDENYQRYLRDGIPFEVTMRAAQAPKYVKVIVYDYAADLLGSSIVKLR